MTLYTAKLKKTSVIVCTNYDFQKSVKVKYICYSKLT